MLLLIDNHLHTYSYSLHMLLSLWYALLYVSASLSSSFNSLISVRQEHCLVQTAPQINPSNSR